MKLVGAEERALWAAAAVRAMTEVGDGGGKETSPERLAQHMAKDAAAVADAVVLEFRTRNGSHP